MQGQTPCPFWALPSPRPAVTEMPPTCSRSPSREDSHQWDGNTHPRTTTPSILCMQTDHVTNSHQWNVGRRDILLAEEPKKQVYPLSPLFPHLLAGCTKPCRGVREPQEGRSLGPCVVTWRRACLPTRHISPGLLETEK